ncbi:unnamed protein product [Sphagnum jensenii]|uniref:Glucose-6-phosphate isomerase n=1 Tax=Sphagnum jensenii TaxID=128206 RepID=A0ABP1AGQ0_9BRYO
MFRKEGLTLYSLLQVKSGGNIHACMQACRPCSSPATGLISSSIAWRNLREHVDGIFDLHLKDLLQDERRCRDMIKEYDGIVLDYSRQRATSCTFKFLLALAKEAGVKEKIDMMFEGKHINKTEDRAVLHVALRAPRTEKIVCDGKNVVPDVWDVLDKIKCFSERVRSGSWVGQTGKVLKDVVAIGIGGSYLGPLFAYTALQTGAELVQLLANVDPIDVAIALNGLCPETTLVVIVSKTFTTQETMLNAKTMRTWLIASVGKEGIAKHMVAVSTNLKLVKEFGLDPDNAFAFWDWVGGRYSVCSAVGLLPLAIQYGFNKVNQFLEGAWSIDSHFHCAPLEDNIPVILGLISIWNVSFLRCPARAILPYSQALQKLAPHIQQVSMESNGKGVSMDGRPLDFHAGEIDFGEPGTNGQHSFYQLIHQVITAVYSPTHVCEPISNHDELMCNFFAQPDALAYGKTWEQAKAEGISDDLIPHKIFTGNRPSLNILLPTLDAYTLGQLLALYEHRVVVQGFIWGINSFDQWGVELGKSLAGKVRVSMNSVRMKGEELKGYNYSTTYLLNRYLKGKTLYKLHKSMLLDVKDKVHLRDIRQLVLLFFFDLIYHTTITSYT